jgi:hypothetical protein
MKMAEMGLARLMWMFSGICQLGHTRNGGYLTFSHFLQTIVYDND